MRSNVTSAPLNEPSIIPFAGAYSSMTGAKREAAIAIVPVWGLPSSEGYIEKSRVGEEVETQPQSMGAKITYAEEINVRQVGDLSVFCSSILDHKAIGCHKGFFLEQAGEYVKALEKSTSGVMGWREVFEPVPEQLGSLKFARQDCN